MMRALLRTHLRGHLLLFDTPESRDYPAKVGIRLLVAFAILEFVLDPRTIEWLQLPAVSPGFFMLLRLVLVLSVVPWVAGIRLSTLGFRRGRDWTTTEASYLVQVLLLAGLVFPLVLAPQWGLTLAEHGWGSVVAAGLVPYFAFGFYQEVAYRGILQTELVRRWGAVPGILVSNAVYAFGPVHASYYALGASSATALFGSVLAIGMLFALVFHRSGNLWIVALMHGTGNAVIAVGMGNLAF